MYASKTTNIIQLSFFIIFGIICSLVLFEDGSSWTPGILLSTLTLVLMCFKKDVFPKDVIDYLKISTTVILLGTIYYVYPLGSEFIRVDDPYAQYDSQKYALSAKLLIETGSGLGHWLSIGIEQYITSIYRILGINEVNILAINSLIFTFTIKIYKDIIWPESNTALSLPLIVCLVPLTFFYSIQPSKEILSIFIVALFIKFALDESDTSFKKLAFGVALFFLALSVRLNLAAFIFAIYIFSTLKLDKKLLRRLMSFTAIGFLGLIGANFVSMALFGLEASFWIKHASSLLNAAETLEALGDSSRSVETGIAGTLKTILSPTNPLLNFLLIPIKMVFVWISPFPVISGVFSIPVTNIEINRYAYTLLASTSGILNFITVPAILLIIKKINKLSKENKYIFLFILTYMAMVSFVYPTQFTRHRTLIEIPMYLLLLKQLNIWMPYYKKVITFVGFSCFLASVILISILYFYV